MSVESHTTCNLPKKQGFTIFIGIGVKNSLIVVLKNDLMPFSIVRCKIAATQKSCRTTIAQDQNLAKNTESCIRRGTSLQR